MGEPYPRDLTDRESDDAVPRPHQRRTPFPNDLEPWWRADLASCCRGGWADHDVRTVDVRELERHVHLHHHLSLHTVRRVHGHTELHIQTSVEPIRHRHA